MKLIEATLPSTAENLAIDEWLLENCDRCFEPQEVLRFWENPTPAVILGRSSKVAEEVNQEYCQTNSIQLFRRSSGGAAVVIGNGCLMYSVVLDYRLRPALRMLEKVHRLVMTRMLKALRSIDQRCQFQGTCDLTLHDKKFSGNALRCQRNALLYHGTLLYDFPLDLIQSCLHTPPRQPDYRQSRGHDQFVTNLNADRSTLRDAIVAAWELEQMMDGWQQPAADNLPPGLNPADIKRLAQKYNNPDWTFKRK